MIEITYEIVAIGLMFVFVIFGLLDPISFILAALMLGLALYFRDKEKRKAEENKEQDKPKKNKKTSD